MGMSASQVRFLSLQHRKHDIGRELSTLSNRKMSLSRDMNRVAKNYTNALNQNVLRWSNDSGATYKNLNYDLMMKPNELNCESPYIITDRQGRVVVDDREITYVKNGETVNTGITYRQLASMVTAYSGVDKDGHMLFENTKGLEGLSGSLFTGGTQAFTADGKYFSFSEVNDTAVSGVRCQVEDGYALSNNKSQLSYDSSLRYEMLARLGIISATELGDYRANIEKLYGSKENQDENDYSLDVNSKYGTQVDEKKKFGVLYTSGDTLKFSGGSAYGNLELAKMYLKEYDLFMSTQMTQKSAPSSYNHTNNTTTNIYNYKYENFITGEDDVEATQGITNRIQDLLTRANSTSVYDNVDADGTYKRDVTVLSMLGDINISSLYGAPGGNGDPRWNDCDVGIANYDTGDLYYNSTSTATQNWEWFFGNNTGDPNADKYNVFSTYDTDGDDDYCDTQYITCNPGGLKSMAEALGNSIKAGADRGIIWDENAAYYAKTMTVAKFMNNYRCLGTDGSWDTIRAFVEDSYIHQMDYDSDRSNDYEHLVVQCQSVEEDDTDRDMREWAIKLWSDCRGNASQINGVTSTVSDDGSCEWIYFAVSVPNFVNTYMTFYTAYIEANHQVPTVASAHQDSFYNVGDVVNGENASFKFGYTGGTASYANAAGVKTDSWGDGNGDGFDDNTGLPFSGNYSQVTFGMNGTTGTGTAEDPYKDQTYKITETAFNYLKTKGSTVPAYPEGANSAEIQAAKEAYAQAIYNDATDAVKNELKQYVQDLDVPGKTPKYKQLYNIAKALQSSGHTYVGGEADCVKTYTSTQSNNVVINGTSYQQVATAVLITDYNGKKQSYNVTFEYKQGGSTVPTPAGAVIRYSESFDAAGNISSAQTESQSTGGSNLYNMDRWGSTQYGENYQNRPVCFEIKTGQNTFWVGPQNDESNYCNYLYIKPEETGLRKKLEILVEQCKQEVANLELALQADYTNTENKFMEFFDRVFKRISENGWVYDDKINTGSKASNEYLEAKLENNNYFVTECRDKDKQVSYVYTTKLAQTCTKIYQIHDSNAENQALSEYEEAKTLIQSKEKKIDARMQKLETEQEVITTELDSLKKVRDDNISKTFKIFA